MKVIRARNVNEALVKGVALLSGEGTIEVAPRGSATREWPTAVATVYDRPDERVLFSPDRDANPFFHFFESLWMLQGRDDLHFPLHFNKRFKEFSDDEQTVWGAYGYRWRGFFDDVDQLAEVVNLLRKDPNTRRAVISMWSPHGDLTPLDGMGGYHSKDVPCNTTIYFKLRDGHLRMTIANRSNDMLWGAYGANAVHLSMLQEYVANKLGARLGLMTQVSDSFHVYTSGAGGQVWEKVLHAQEQKRLQHDLYSKGGVTSHPLGVEPAWDVDLHAFFEAWDFNECKGLTAEDFETKYFQTVVLPLWDAYRLRDPEQLMKCAATDWRVAGAEWLLRRKQGGDNV